MLQIAEKIIEQQEAKFDPTEFKDRYEDALRDLIARKSKGEKLVTSAVPEEDDKVVDLMEALKKSLKGSGSLSRDKADRFLEAQARKAKPKARKKASARNRAA
jgi:DNA end-binding protein Ku